MSYFSPLIVRFDSGISTSNKTTETMKDSIAAREQAFVAWLTGGICRWSGKHNGGELGRHKLGLLMTLFPTS